MEYKVEFVEFVPKTGATTDRALFRVYQGEDWLFSVASGLSLTLLASLGGGEERLREAQRLYAQQVIEQRLASDRSWVETARGRTDVQMDLNSYNVDVGHLRRLWLVRSAAPNGSR